MARFSPKTTRRIVGMVRKDRALPRAYGGEIGHFAQGPLALFAVTTSSISAATANQLGSGTAKIVYANATGALTTSSTQITVWNQSSGSIASGVNIGILNRGGLWCVDFADC